MKRSRPTKQEAARRAGLRTFWLRRGYLIGLKAALVAAERAPANRGFQGVWAAINDLIEKAPGGRGKPKP